MRTAPLLLCLLAAGAARAQPIALNSTTPSSTGAFGWSISQVPDVNADGKPDIVIGAQREAIPSNIYAGRVHVYSGATGASLHTINPPTVQQVGTFGWAVAGMPDVTGDGRGDILIGGLWETDTSGLICGRAYLYSGATGGLIRAWLSPNRQDSGGFGGSVAWVPDVNGDGKPDIVISAAGEQVGSSAAAGRVYLYSGATGALIRTLVSPAPEPFADFGVSVAGLPDVDGDGRGDIAVGAPFANPNTSPTDCGRVYIFSGATGALIRAMGSPLPQTRAYFGDSIAVLGDINGDGKADLAIGAPGADDGHGGKGMVFLFSGATGAGLRHLRAPLPQKDFGISVAAVPDMNGDGRDEVIVGTDGETPPYIPRVYVFSGASGVVLRTITSPTPNPPAGFGAAVCGLRDTNGDGRGDFVIGAYREPGPAGPTNQGRAYLFR